jgi:REP element-mobilizing transposase RayT
MNRGRRHENIFTDKTDYALFIELLMELSGLFQVRISAYCLMSNHYHLLLQTPKGNLSRSMQRLNSIYSQRYNRKHGFDGPLFRGRYKSILVSADSYLLQLMRYIHKNPVRAGMVKAMEDYLWSSYPGYLSYAKKWDWLNKDPIFALLTPKKKGRLGEFVKFMGREDSAEVTQIFSKQRLPALFGPNNFIARIKEARYFNQRDYEIPESKRMVPEAETIIAAVCRYYAVEPQDLLITRRGVFNKPRAVAVYLVRQLRGDELNTIKTLFGINTYSTVSSIIQKVAVMVTKDRKLRDEIDEMKEIANNYQI